MMSNSLSSSYKDYPVIHPFINTHTSRHTVLSKALPESNSSAILSALRNLQEKIRTLEKERGEATHTPPIRDRDTHSHANTPQHTHKHEHTDTHSHTDTHTHRDRHSQSDTHTQKVGERETSDQSACNQALVTQLAAAEARCRHLDKQLDHMRRVVRSAQSDRTTLLRQQVSMETPRSAHGSHDSCSGHAQLEKLEHLEQEYLRLTHTQEHAERKIHQLEIKLQEDQQQIKMIQTGLEANRILLQSVSPRPPRRIKEKRRVSKTAVESLSKPHYRLSLGDVPFVTGTSPGCSHSVRANVQAVLSLLKQHQPQLCNARVLSHIPLEQRTTQAANRKGSDSGSSSSCSGGEELADLLVALQDELHHMSLEQQALMQKAELCVSLHERSQLYREQEELLKKMERKGEHINKLLKHQTQVKRLRKEVCGHKRGVRGQVRVPVTPQGGSARAVTAGPVTPQGGSARAVTAGPVTPQGGSARAVTAGPVTPQGGSARAVTAGPVTPQGGSARAVTAGPVTPQGGSARAVTAGPGDRSKTSLKLLRDMKTLQSSLRT